jgi:Na+/glutamate symporter
MLTKRFSGFFCVAIFGSTLLVPVQAEAQYGGVVGGIIGGAIAGSIVANSYRERREYRARRAAPRHHVARASSHDTPSHNAPSENGSTNKAVINTAADPFASPKPSADAPIPVSAKP